MALKTKTAKSKTNATLVTSKRAAAVKEFLDGKTGAAGTPIPGARGPGTGARLYKIFGKMFAIYSPQGSAFVTVKCDPHLVEILKEKYDGVGHRGHLDRRFWICVRIDEDVPLAEIKRVIALSYDLVAATLTKKQQAELAALD